MNSERIEKIKQLFSPVEHPFRAKNRFVSASMTLGGCKENGELSLAEHSRFIEKAAADVGTLITGGAFVSANGKYRPGQLGMDSDERIADAAKLAKTAKRYDARFIVQLSHAGGYALADAVSPSGGFLPKAKSQSRQMTREEIAQTVSDFAAAAARAKAGGADGVEIQAAHGFLPTQFLSPDINKREDEYGGSFENRERFALEILSAVRNSVGTDFTILFKASATEGTETGYGFDEGLRFCEDLLNAGADGIEVSCGTFYSSSEFSITPVGVGPGKEEGHMRAYSGILKQRYPDKLIILTGGIRSLEEISVMADENAADLFGMARPFNAEGDLINRWCYDDNRPAACFSCNACLKLPEEKIIDCPIMRVKTESQIWDEVPEC